jgi:hypothetical protein
MAGRMVLGFANVKMVAVQAVHWLQIAIPELSKEIKGLEKLSGTKQGTAIAAVKETFGDVLGIMHGDKSSEAAKAVAAMEKAGELSEWRPIGKKTFGATAERSMFGMLDKVVETTNSAPDRMRVLSTFLATRHVLLAAADRSVAGWDAAANLQAARTAMKSVDMTGANRSTIPIFSGGFGDLAMKYKSFLFNLMAKHKLVWDMGPGASLRKAVGAGDGMAMMEVSNPKWRPGGTEPRTVEIGINDWAPYGQMAGTMALIGGATAIPGAGYVVDWFDWLAGTDSKMQLKQMMREGAKQTGSKTLEVMAGGISETMEKGVIGALTGFNLSETGAMFFPSPEKTLGNYLTPAAVSIAAQYVKRGVGALEKEDANFNPLVYKSMQMLKAFSPNSLRRVIENMELLYNDNNVYDKDGRLVSKIPGFTEDFLARVQVMLGGLAAEKGEAFRIYQMDKEASDRVRAKHTADTFRVAQRVTQGEPLQLVDMEFLQRVPGAGKMVQAEARKLVVTSEQRLRENIMKVKDPVVRMERWNLLVSLVGTGEDETEVEGE